MFDNNYMNTIAYILSASLIFGFVIDVLPARAQPSGLSVTTCSGKTVFLDLNPEGPAPVPPHKLKPCHAICCSDDDEASEDNAAL